MKLEDLESYRENGYINMDKFLEDYPSYKDGILREVRGSQNREKDWISLDDSDILLRTENMRELGVEYTSFAEILTEEVAKQVNIPCAHYDLIKYKGKEGVLSKSVVNSNQSLINISNILQQLDPSLTTEDTLDFIKFDDVLGGIKTLKDYEEDMTSEDVHRIQMDFLKIAIFDIFSLNTDRNGQNFSVIYDNGHIKMAPIYDNEHSFGGGMDKEKINGVNSSRDIAKLESDLMLSVLEPPADAMEELEDSWQDYSPRYEEKNKKPLNWQASIFVLGEFLESEELEDFFKLCYDKINLDEAFKSVEARIGIDIPKEYKDGVKNIYDVRREYIDSALILKEDIEYDRDFLERD